MKSTVSYTPIVASPDAPATNSVAPSDGVAFGAADFDEHDLVGFALTIRSTFTPRPEVDVGRRQLPGRFAPKIVQLLPDAPVVQHRWRDAGDDRIAADAHQRDIDADFVVRAGKPASFRVPPVAIDEHHLAHVVLCARVAAASAPLVAGVDQRTCPVRVTRSPVRATVYVVSVVNSLLSAAPCGAMVTLPKIAPLPG